MVKNLRLSSKNAFAVNITIAPTSYVTNGGSQESGATALATVQAENTEALVVAYPKEGNRFLDGNGFQDFDATAKLAIDGGTGIICRGMVFAISGVSGDYVVTSVSNATLNKAFLAPSVTTIYFKRINGGNLASSPSDGVALTFETTFRLPPFRMERDITIVNNDSSNAISLFISKGGTNEELHALTQPSARFATYPLATLASSAAMTLELSDASDIYIKGAADATITLFGS